MPNTTSNSLSPVAIENQISVADLRCSRGEKTLFERLSFTANKGDCLHIIGPNGAGKTTLLRALCGLNKPDHGEICWRSQPIFLSDAFAHQAIYIGHKDGLKNELTALENLRFTQQLEFIHDEEALEDCLLGLKILECADLPAQALSFGQRRRLSFAKLLLHPKPLWILDEPFTGIDAQGRELIEQLCVKHLQENGIIVMTHHRSLQETALGAFSEEVFIHHKEPA